MDDRKEDAAGEPKRARRRRDLVRMKARCRRVFPWIEHPKHANHLKACSCWMCGNPRRFGDGDKPKRSPPSLDDGEFVESD